MDAPASAFRILSRSLRLCCPRCGAGRLYRRPFSMQRFCAGCGFDLGREHGFYIGSIYVNYGLTALLTVAFAVAFPGAPRWPLVTFIVFFPILFFHHARSLWLGLDWYFSSRAGEGTGAPPRDPL